MFMSKDERDTQRKEFEQEMRENGWVPTKGRFGTIVGWTCGSRKVDDKYAFGYFVAAGQTPVRPDRYMRKYRRYGSDLRTDD